MKIALRLIAAWILTRRLRETAPQDVIMKAAECHHAAMMNMWSLYGVGLPPIYCGDPNRHAAHADPHSACLGV